MRTVAAALAVSMLLVACKDDSTSDPSGSRAPVTAAPRSAPTSVTSPSSPALLYFTGSYDAKTQQMTITVASPGAKPAITLPEGTGANQVQLDTVAGSVSWQGPCGTNTLCGTVYVQSDYTVALENVASVIDTITLSTVTAVTNPLPLGGCSAGGKTGTAIMAFLDPGGANFSFSGHVTGDLVPSDGGSPGTAMAPAGNVSHSSKYTLVGTLGQAPGGNNASASSKYQLRGGLVGSTQAP